MARSYIFTIFFMVILHESIACCPLMHVKRFHHQRIQWSDTEKKVPLSCNDSTKDPSSVSMPNITMQRDVMSTYCFHCGAYSTIVNFLKQTFHLIAELVKWNSSPRTDEATVDNSAMSRNLTNASSTLMSIFQTADFFPAEFATSVPTTTTSTYSFNHAPDIDDEPTCPADADIATFNMDGVAMLPEGTASTGMEFERMSTGLDKKTCYDVDTVLQNVHDLYKLIKEPNVKQADTLMEHIMTFIGLGKVLLSLETLMADVEIDPDMVAVGTASDSFFEHLRMPNDSESRSKTRSSAQRVPFPVGDNISPETIQYPLFATNYSRSAVSPAAHLKVRTWEDRRQETLSRTTWPPRSASVEFPTRNRHIPSIDDWMNLSEFEPSASRVFPPPLVVTIIIT